MNLAMLVSRGKKIRNWMHYLLKRYLIDILRPNLTTNIAPGPVAAEANKN